MTIDCVWMGHHDDLPDANGYTVGWTYFVHPGYAYLSNHYRTEVAPIRQPIVVILPSRPRPAQPAQPASGDQPAQPARPARSAGAFGFCIDTHPVNPDEPPDPSKAWTVAVDLASLVIGAKPLITVSPSIDCKGAYHGFLTAGTITDDLGG